VGRPEEQGDRRKHGYDFAEADLVFKDNGLVLELDRVDENGVERCHAIGLLPRGPLLLVVHIHKGVNENGEETIRIISAGAASPHEGRRYFQQATH
jgi:uncharacterized DUF497 family protein